MYIYIYMYIPISPFPFQHSPIQTNECLLRFKWAQVFLNQPSWLGQILKLDPHELSKTSEIYTSLNHFIDFMHSAGTQDSAGAGAYRCSLLPEWLSSWVVCVSCFPYDAVRRLVGAQLGKSTSKFQVNYTPEI